MMPTTKAMQRMQGMKDLYHKRDTCRMCLSKAVELAVPLAPMPIATPNFQIPDASLDDPVYRTAVPLELYLCRDCGLLQILHVGNPELQYRNYVYTTSLSLGLPEHFVKYADAVITSLGLRAGSLVVELGSNDGTLLRAFKERGMRVLGVDPAVEIARRATTAGIETVGDFFTDKLGAELRGRYGSADVIIANNMIANVDDLESLAKGVRGLLGPDGCFVFETQYGVDVTEKNLLDTVYHEHLSYFNIKPVSLFFERLGMRLIDVVHIWTKGGSFRATVQLASGRRRPTPAVATFMVEEARLGVEGLDYYRTFSGKIAAIREELTAIVDRHHADGRKVAGYGVSVGTTALLPQFGLAQKIDFLVDDDPNKPRVLAGPGYDIPIFPPAALYEQKPASVVVFAWRYAQPIMAKHPDYFAQGGRFVIPLPCVAVHDRNP
jgi:SAM-dependent methyltransferase